MADALVNMISNPDSVVAMSPRQLAGAILEAMRRQPRLNDLVNRQDLRFNHMGGDTDAVTSAIYAVFHWLCTEGYLMPARDNGWFEPTPIGRAMMVASRFPSVGLPTKLPDELLHPLVVEHAESEHLRGAHDAAVFTAFKRLEILVGTKVGSPPGKLGVDLMRFAFHPQNGPLRDEALPDAERESEAHLFAGTVGRFRNATGHRDVNLGPTEAAQLLVLASMLINIAERRTPVLPASAKSTNST